MSALVDARPHASAVKSAIAAALGSSHVYDHSEVPGGSSKPDEPLPNIFVLVAIEVRYSPVLRGGRGGNAGIRVVTAALGRTVSECQWAQHKVELALNEQVLTIADKATTRIQRPDGMGAPRFDEPRYVADTFYTYAH